MQVAQETKTGQSDLETYPSQVRSGPSDLKSEAGDEDWVLESQPQPQPQPQPKPKIVGTTAPSTNH